MPPQRWKVTLALAGAVAATASSAAARPRRRPRPVALQRPAPSYVAPSAREGRVAFVTDKRAYLDHGADGGLTLGRAVPLFRAGRAAGTCTVEVVGAHVAACTGGRPRIGDSFRLTRAVAGQSAQPATTLPPVADVETLRDDARAIAEAGVQKVDYAGQAAFGARQALAFTAGYASWAASSDPRSQFRQERIDASVRVRLGNSGLRLDAAFSAVHWQPRPEQTRFRADRPTQFYLWEAEVSRREGDTRTVVAVGRLWPWHTPGLGVLDGFQVGRRSEDHGSEWGAYGGLIPDVLSLAPSTDTWTGGVYAGLTQAGTKRDFLRLAREEARLGVRHVPDLGLVGEAELLAQAWLGRWTVGGGGRAVLVPGAKSGPALDRAFLDVRAQPTLTMGAGVHVRYFGAALDAQEAFLRDVTPSLQGRYHAAGDAHWDLLPWLGLGVLGDVSHDAEAGLVERDGAIELRLPRVFGDHGGLWLGGEAAEGWLRSRSLYGQVLGRFRDRVRLLARVSATASDFLVPAANPNTQELDGFLQLDASVAAWLRLRGRALLRAPLGGVGQAANTGMGLVLGLDATGMF
jgi:hypothetical protein